MKNLETLKAELSKLTDKLRGEYGAGKSKEVLTEIRAKEAEIKEAKTVLLLAKVNREQNELREAAKQVWECEQPETDITTNDGSFHAVKVRKYPNLAALKYARASWKDGRLTKISFGRKEFEMFKTKFIGYGQPYEYERPATFEDFLALNSIMPQEITIAQFKEIEAKNEAANLEYKEAVKRFDAAKQNIGMHSLSYYGLFGQRNAGQIYEYTPNY